MDNHTVVQLKAFAKKRGIGGYCKLRKAELIHALKAIRLVDQTSNIFGDSIKNDPTPALQPTPWRPSNIVTKDKQNIKNVITKGMQKIRYFGEWLWNYIAPKPKVVGKVLESFNNKTLKLYEKRDTCANQCSQICFEELGDSVSNKRIKLIRPRIISA